MAQAHFIFVAVINENSMKNKKDSELELIEKYAFILGRKDSTEDVVESYRDTAEELGCFSF